MYMFHHIIYKFVYLATPIRIYLTGGQKLVIRQEKFVTRLVRRPKTQYT